MGLAGAAPAPASGHHPGDGDRLTASLRMAEEMHQEDEETPPCKGEHGGTASSEGTLLGMKGKEQDPGIQEDVHSPSPSGQEEWAQPQSKGAPQGQSGQVSESPSISYGYMGPPELPLEKSVPMGEGGHSLEVKPEQLQ